MWYKEVYDGVEYECLLVNTTKGTRKFRIHLTTEGVIVQSASFTPEDSKYRVYKTIQTQDGTLYRTMDEAKTGIMLVMGVF